VNRRVDPTVYRTTPGGTNLGDSIRFFSTIEFDSLVAGSHLNNYTYPQYAQEGAREITLPFNYTAPIGFALLRVHQLGGTLDTVIAQNQPLSLMFKPGEGKLLHVEILHPEKVSGGRLDYNGQRKLVSWPDAEDPERIRYHMAYYRSVSGRRRVYYRRSEPVARNSSQENILWETEVDLAETVNDENGQPLLQQPDCAYPSIVVRHDAAGNTDRVYVVFACNA